LITSLQRGSDAKSLVVTQKEADRLVNRNMLIVLTKEDNATNGQDPNNTELLEDKNNDRGYNSFWIDPGTKLATVKGREACARHGSLSRPMAAFRTSRMQRAVAAMRSPTSMDPKRARWPSVARWASPGHMVRGDDERHVQQHDAVRADADQRGDHCGDRIATRA